MLVGDIFRRQVGFDLLNYPSIGVKKVNQCLLPVVAESLLVYFFFNAHPSKLGKEPLQPVAVFVNDKLNTEVYAVPFTRITNRRIMAKEDLTIRPNESGNNSLFEALGLSDEREMMSEASASCYNANKLPFVCYVIGAEGTGATAFEAGITAAKIFGGIESVISQSTATGQTPSMGMFLVN